MNDCNNYPIIYEPLVDKYDINWYSGEYMELYGVLKIYLYQALNFLKLMRKNGIRDFSESCKYPCSSVRK